MSTGRKLTVDLELTSEGWGQKCLTRGIAQLEKNGDKVAIEAPDLKTQSGSSFSCLSSTRLHFIGKVTENENVVEGSGKLKLLKVESMENMTIKGDKSFQKLPEGESVQYQIEQSKYGYRFYGRITPLSTASSEPLSSQSAKSGKGNR